MANSLAAATLALAVVMATSGGYAATSPAQKCQGAKLKAISKRMSCCFAAKRKALGGTPEDLSGCAAKFDAAFAKAEQKAGGACPTSADATMLGAKADAYCADLADDLAGPPPPPPASSLYVATAVGNDANPGTMAAPLRTIGRAIANAVAAGGPFEVLVAEGSYAEKVTLAEGVSVLGGHACTVQPCTWARDPVLHDTAIVDQDFEGVLAPDVVTRATRLDGFRVMGMGGMPASAPGSAAITLRGTPTVRGNRIVGGDVTGGATLGARQSAAVLVLAPTSHAEGALIDANVITGGTSTEATAAVLFGAVTFPPPSPAVAVITNNTIRAGNGRATSALDASYSGTGTLVQGNDILAATSTSGASWGVMLSSTATLDRNRINVDQTNVGGCTGSTLCGGIASFSATATITNNVVFGVRSAQSAALFLTEVETAAGVVVVNGNYLDGGGLAALTAGSVSAAVRLSIGGCTTCGFNAAIGRIRNNILAGGNNERRYGAYDDPAQARTVRPSVVENNDFFFAPASGRTDVVYHSVDAAGIGTDYTLATLNMQSWAMANFSADPLLDATFHLRAGSPCIDAGTTIEAPANDIDGDVRPRGAGIDVGPDEAQ